MPLNRSALRADAVVMIALSRMLVLLLPLVALACRSTPPAGRSDASIRPAVAAAEPVPQMPWTERFGDGAALLADEICIEGPPGLLDHVAVTQDPEQTRYVAKTVSEGLLQETRARSDAGYVEIHGQLDAWRLVALRRLVVLERPGEVPVTIVARGQAFWRAVDGDDEQRGPELRFTGLRPR